MYHGIINHYIIQGAKKIEEKRINTQNNNKFSEENIGLMLWKLESLEDFYPTYKTIIKKE